MGCFTNISGDTLEVSRMDRRIIFNKDLVSTIGLLNLTSLMLVGIKGSVVVAWQASHVTFKES